MEKGAGGSAPTGCYKCGRPGHWSRDCPVNPNSDSNNNLSTNPKENAYNTKASTSYPFKKKAVATLAEKPKRLSRSRPKLTPDLLLSNDGLGHVLRHFPRAFKYRGRGHEVSDLGNLLGLYAEWHKRLIPYYSFDQFVHKIEQVGTTRRVKTCIQELREKIADGQDPAKLHDTQVQPEISSHEQDAQDTQDRTPVEEITSVLNPDTENLEENMLNEVWEKAAEGPSQPLCDLSGGADAHSGGNEPPSKPQSTSGAVMMSEEQRARMEANRMKALERAAARKQSSC